MQEFRIPAFLPSRLCLASTSGMHTMKSSYLHVMNNSCQAAICSTEVHSRLTDCTDCSSTESQAP